MEKLNHNKLRPSSNLAFIVWTKMKTTTGMTKDPLAGRQREDVVVSGTVFWSPKPFFSNQV